MLRRRREFDDGMFLIEQSADVDRLVERMFDAFDATDTSVDRSGVSSTAPELVRLVSGRDRRGRLVWQIAVYRPVHVTGGVPVG